MLAALSVIVIITIALGVGAAITLALSGVLAERFPVLDARLNEAMRHLNGEAAAPEKVQRLFQS